MTGCNVDQSSYMMKNQLPNIMSNCFVTLWYDNNGDIQYYTLEPMVFSSSDVTEKDYLKPKKYIKNKILTLSKKTNLFAFCLPLDTGSRCLYNY